MFLAGLIACAITGILILVRIFRYVFNKFIVDYIKNGIKYIVHKFDKKK